MGVDEIHRLGCGDRCDTQHGERMHQEFVTGMKDATQKISATFSSQTTSGRFEQKTVEIASQRLQNKLMKLKEKINNVHHDHQHKEALDEKWNYYNANLPRSGSCCGFEGQYSVVMSEQIQCDK
jgi:hypothetical protein